MPGEGIVDSTPVSEAPVSDAIDSGADERFFPPNYTPDDDVAESILGRGRDDEGDETPAKPEPKAKPAKARVSSGEPQPPAAGEQTNEPAPQRKYGEDHYRAAKYFGGMDPELVDALGWEKVAPFLQLRKQLAEQQQQLAAHQRQQGQPPQQQRQPPTQPHTQQPPAPTQAQIDAWKWEQGEDEYPVDPRIVKRSEYEDRRYQQIQDAFEARLKAFAEHLAPFQRHIEAQANAAREAAGREFHAAVDEIDDPEVLGPPEAANWQARHELWDLAHTLLQAGKAHNLKDATRRAFNALHPDRVGVKPLKKVAAAVKDRRGQVVAEPSRRDAEMPLGPDRAARALRQRIQELQGE